jgi:hypothetical protein
VCGLNTSGSGYGVMNTVTKLRVPQKVGNLASLGGLCYMELVISGNMIALPYLNSSTNHIRYI